MLVPPMMISWLPMRAPSPMVGWLQLHVFVPSFDVAVREDARKGADHGVFADGDAAAVVQAARPGGSLRRRRWRACSHRSGRRRGESSRLNPCVRRCGGPACSGSACPATDSARSASGRTSSRTRAAACGSANSAWIHVAEVLRFEGHVLRVERHAEHVAGQFAGERDVGFAAVGPAQIELVELVAHDFSAALGGAMAVELLVEKRIQRRKTSSASGVGWG